MKAISRDEYLKSLGLWHLAREYRIKYEELEEALNNLLKINACSHVADSIWAESDTMDAALKREGIEVSDV
jgi:hypothetical protein